MASDVVPVSAKPCSLMAADFASTMGRRMPTFPSMFSGNGDTTQVLIVPGSGGVFISAADLLWETTVLSS